MLDILFNEDKYLILVSLVIYLMVCQLVAKRKGFVMWYLDGVIYGLSLPIMVVGIGLGAYKLLGGY